jgi:hypothetical protein
VVFIKNSINKNTFPVYGHIRKSRNARRGTGDVLYRKDGKGQGKKKIGTGKTLPSGKTVDFYMGDKFSAGIGRTAEAKAVFNQPGMASSPYLRLTLRPLVLFE